MILREYEVPVEDRGAFVKFMALVAYSDGVVGDEEREAIESAVRVWDLNAETANQIQEVMERGADAAELAKEFRSKKAKYLLLQELITLCELDGTYTDRERLAMTEIAELLGISRTRLTAIEGWVEAGMRWRQSNPKR